MSQLSFSFQGGDFYKEEDFLLLSENASAWNFLKKFFAQKDFTSSQIPSLILKGEEACGKTHILNIFSKKFNAEFLDHKQIAKINPSGFFVRNRFFILEDIEKIKDEELVLHLINSASEANAFLILSAKENPHFRLKDLNSRLKNIVITEIKNPSHEAIIHLLANGFSRRQIKLPKRSLEFISNHIERNYLAISVAIKKVEFFCQENKKNPVMKDLINIFSEKI